MSLHSNIQSQNPQAQASHRNHPHPPPAAHSQNAQQNHSLEGVSKEWVATYLEGQFYLTDPESISKLKNIQVEIQSERLRLARLQENSLSHNNSFLSVRQDREDRQSNHSFCTQFDQSRHFSKQQEVRNDLEREEELYRQKLRMAQREKAERKRQVPTAQERKKEKEEENTPILLPATHAQVQKSAKMSKKASQQENIEKSYHKSRIEKSIKKSVKINQQLIQQCPEKSVRGSVKPNHEQVVAASEKEKTDKSINIVIVQPDHTIMPNQQEKMVEKSVKGSISPEKSAKISVKHSVKDQKLSVRVSQKPALSQKSAKLELIQDNKSSIILQKQEKKSVHDASVHEDQLYPSSPTKSHKSSQLHQFLQVQNKNQQTKSVKYSEKVASHHSKAPSHKAESFKPSEKHSIAKNSQKLVQIEQQKSASASQKALSHHQQKSQKVSSVAVVQQQHVKSVRSPSRRGSSRHSKAKQLQQSIRLSEKLNAEPIIIPTIEKSVKQAQKEESVKSHQPVESQEARSKKSSRMVVQEDAKSKRTNNNIQEAKSEKSAIKSQIRTHKEQIINNSHVVSQRRSFSKKSSAHVVQAIQTAQIAAQSQTSLLASQTSQKAQSPHIKQTDSQMQHSIRDISSFNGESIKQSSRVRVVVNELPPEVKEAVPQYNMRKQKVQQNQSEKKSSRSFVIHSRNGSVKDKLSNSHISSPSRKSKDLSSVGQESVTKGEIIKLHEQIALLQEKLRRVEERQEQMERLQGTLSKIQLQEQEKEKEVIELEKPIEQVEVQEAKEQKQQKVQEMPVIQLTDIQIRPQPRLQIQSSILQVNTIEQVRKQQQKQQQHGQKARLKDEISRLKRIIRDMQIEKIRSIDLQAEDPTPQASRIQKESLNSLQGTHTRRFGSTNKRLLEDAGKIVPNNSSAFHTETPRRKSLSKIRLPQEEGSEIGQLPPDSGKRINKGKLYVEARRGEFAAKINEKQKDFHSFIQSSRVIAEQTGRTQPQTNPFKNFSKVTVQKDVDYSRLVQEMKKPNPQQDEVLPQIHLRDLQMPALPDGPHGGMTQEQLLSLARSTYMAFGIDVQAQGRQLCVKKYKNCVIFTLDGQNHQCVLWHFSGKFYMGSWRTGEPGQGEKQGQGLELVPGKHIYKGQFLAGKRHGSGILKQSNGNIYDGQWSDGLKNGRGVYLDAATRVLYSGEWRQGRKEGQGFLKLSQKQYYFGTFVKSIKEGFGVQVFVNGDKYRGQYKGGKFHGRGKYLWANGSCYQGQFYQGVRHGQGSWRSARNSPDIYIGSYDKDKKTGYGRYVWSNGCMYEGGFANDLKHGKGRLTYQDGKEIKGVWEEGNLVSTEQEKRQVEHEEQPLRRSVKVASFLPASAKRI